MRRRVRGLGIAGAVGIVGMVVALVAAVLLRGVWVAHGAPGHTHTQPHSHTAAAPAIASGSCTLSHWTVVSTPTTPGGVLRATAAASGSDVWAAGYYDDVALQANQTLIEHWNGFAWSIVPSPNTGPTDNQLYGVAALATNDVWAVGYFGSNSTFAWQTLVEHWNGFAWSIVPSPDVAGSGYNYLASISAVSTNDIWAVGAYLDGTARDDRTLTEHWDGTQWSIIPGANPGEFPNDLLGVTAISTDDVWAVGFYDDVNSFVGALMEHWDGTSWTALPSLGDGSQLFAVAAASSHDVWGVGIQEGSGGVSLPLTAHWDGTTWSITPAPNGARGILSTVSVVSSTDVWAGGSNELGAPELTEHWNGSQWSVVPITGASSLYGLAAISASDVWVVGTSSAGDTFTARYRRILPALPGMPSTTSHARPLGPGGAILCP